jgi:hypothetical protein
MQSLPTIIILKTTAQHMKGVIDHQKFALDRPMSRAHPGDLILIAEIQRSGPAVARYAMWLKAQYPDEAHESESIWGRRWNFLIEGEGGHALASPFAPGKVKPKGPYGQGGPLVYVLPEHAEDFRRAGLLAPFFEREQ